MQFNSSMDVSTLRNCNPDREHLFATEGSISIEKGGVKEVYGWEQNRWTNPCGWCSVPNWDVLVAKNDELVNLKNSFSNLYNREFSTIKNKKQIQVSCNNWYANQSSIIYFHSKVYSPQNI